MITTKLLRRLQLFAGEKFCSARGAQQFFIGKFVFFFHFWNEAWQPNRFIWMRHDMNVSNLSALMRSTSCPPRRPMNRDRRASAYIRNATLAIHISYNYVFGCKLQYSIICAQIRFKDAIFAGRCKARHLLKRHWNSSASDALRFKWKIL